MGRQRGNRPPKEVTQERETKAWILRQQGYTQEQIGEQLGVSQKAICDALNRLNDRYLKNNLQQVERVKVEQTRILWWILAECLRAWESSKEPQERVTQGGDGSIITTVVRREGNAVYLHTAFKAMADIRSIWGADVQPAQQDSVYGIAQLIADIENRTASHEQRKLDPAPPISQPPSDQDHETV